MEDLDALQVNVKFMMAEKSIKEVLNFNQLFNKTIIGGGKEEKLGSEKQVGNIQQMYQQILDTKEYIS